MSPILAQKVGCDHARALLREDAEHGNGGEVCWTFARYTSRWLRTYFTFVHASATRGLQRGRFALLFREVRDGGVRYRRSSRLSRALV